MQILGDALKDKILLFIQNAKYALILNCSPDTGKTEQMIVIIHFVSCSEEKVEIEENYLDFVETFDSTA